MAGAEGRRASPLSRRIENSNSNFEMIPWQWRWKIGGNIEIRAGETRKKRADSRGCHEANNLISPVDVCIYVLD